MKFIIDDRLNSLNDYTKACRKNAYAGATMKKQNERVVMYYIRKNHLKKIENYPIKARILWFEKNKRRDIDNITFATKFILDALVKMKIIEDDSQQYVTEIEHHVSVDTKKPRIEVELIENDSNS